MEWKIGEIRQVNGEWYQCLKSPEKGISCDFCSLFRPYFVCPDCFQSEREDNTKVIFKKLEKVGEPFERNGYLYQEYKTHTYPLLMSGDAKIPTFNGFAVKIKQNKEDMEEKKQNCNGCKYSDEEMKIIEKAEKDVRKAMGGAFGLPKDIPYLHSFVSSALELGWLDKYKEHSNSEKIGKNLKPFSLELAKAGKPVCTRDGRKARIICFDRKGDQPIIALIIDEERGIESIGRYFKNGHLIFENAENRSDLMMLPEKKEGWVNVYCGQVYNSLEIAERAVDYEDNFLKTIKIDWEE